MARYDRGFAGRRYDYGLRGWEETTGARFRGERSGPAPGREPVNDRRAQPRTHRITARYNMDYIYGARGEDTSARAYGYPRNYNLYTGDRPDRIGDERFYRQPYTTIGGTWTSRGTRAPTGYDREFGDYDFDFRDRLA